MRALKQFVSAPVVVSICIALLWGICAISVAAIYPTASQSTSAYRLANFSGTALTLIKRLQHEQAAAAAYLSTDASEALATRVKKSAKTTDRHYAVLRKSIDRFNSDDYGSDLTTALGEANSLLADLNGLRTRILESAVSAEEAVEHYTQIVSMLSKPISLLGMQTLSHNTSDQSLKAYQRTIKADATRSAYLFVALTLVASLATLVAIMWLRPAYFRQGLLAVLVFGNLALIAWSIMVGPDWLIKESGPLESLQAFALAAAFFIFCADTANTKDAPRVVAVIFTCACFLLFFREFDFRVYGAPEWLISVSSGPGRRILFVAIIAALIVYVATQRQHFRAMVRPFLKWTAWPLLLWLPLLLAGELIEVVTHATQKDGLPGYWTNGQFWEELLELDAYLVLLFGAYVFGEIFGLRTQRDSDARLRSIKCAPAAKKQ